ncbi:MAG: beta-N-acetylhexosaminidase [Candidatus Competibacterales bacterium]
MSRGAVQNLPLPGLMVGTVGLSLTAEDIDRLCHPKVVGVILFARNFEDLPQLTALVTAIKRLRQPPLLVAVDQEGGPVQRFGSPFTPLPAAASLGRYFDRDPVAALGLAQRSGRLMAAELAAAGVDFSFAPVLDLQWGVSSIIGERSFHRDPLVVSALASMLIDGMAAEDMAAVGKHFPGHGGVAADSHTTLPVDCRPLGEIEANDLIPFAALAPRLAGVMPAHVLYQQVDPRPAGFSSLWLDDVLRRRLGYRGLVVSDDLDMAGAAFAGEGAARVEAAVAAGCQLLLVCNDLEAAGRAAETLAAIDSPPAEVPPGAWAPLARPRTAPLWSDLRHDAFYRRTRDDLEALVALESNGDGTD